MGSAQTEHRGAYCLGGSRRARVRVGRGAQRSPGLRGEWAVAWQQADFSAHLVPHLQVGEAQQKGLIRAHRHNCPCQGELSAASPLTFPKPPQPRTATTRSSPSSHPSGRKPTQRCPSGPNPGPLTLAHLPPRRRLCPMAQGAEGREVLATPWWSPENMHLKHRHEPGSAGSLCWPLSYLPGFCCWSEKAATL